MNVFDTSISSAFGPEDPFGIIKPEEFERLGIEASDIPPGTLPAHKHPSQLPSRFGGNAYGFGLFELYDRLDSQEVELLQSISTENPEQIKRHFKQINRIYYRIGLLKRYSALGKSYFLIPVHLTFSSLSRMKSKADEITKIIIYHRKKYLQESHAIGLITHAEDFLANDLSIRFKEHQFVVLDSLDKLSTWPETLDLIILARDPIQALFMEHFFPGHGEKPSPKVLEAYVVYLLTKIYRLLKAEGELFIIADRHTPKTSEQIKVTFKNFQEEKNFILFSHIFKTQKKYRLQGKSLPVQRSDFQAYLNMPYVEKEVMDRLLGGKAIDELSPEQLNALPYLHFRLEKESTYDQTKQWPKWLSIFFNPLFLKPLLPSSVRGDWDKKFSTGPYSPDYMLIYLGQKKPLPVNLADLKKAVAESGLAGCSFNLLADYRDSFSYVIRTLNVLKRMKADRMAGIANFYIGRLQEPLQKRSRRYAALNDVFGLIAKIKRLEEISAFLNPEGIEGVRTSTLKNLELLSLFGFRPAELKEILLITVGHTAMDRILTGKMNEKNLQPISDLARTYDIKQALHLLRYCRLMSMAETVASRKTDLNQEELAELFELYEALVRVVTTPDLDWDRLLDEKLGSPDGPYRYVIRKILKMKNRFQFLENWMELAQKGEMEKEVLTDYSEEKLKQMEDVLDFLKESRTFEEKYFREDPLQTAAFYRKLIQMEFHGTGRLFEHLPSRVVYLLLWISVHVTRHPVLNFNPVLADLSGEKADSRIHKLITELESIPARRLNLPFLNLLSEQLYQRRSAFIPGSGLQFKINESVQALDIAFVDLDQDLQELESMATIFFNHEHPAIVAADLKSMGILFSRLEDFYQGYQAMKSMPEARGSQTDRQNQWHQKITDLRDLLKKNLLKVILKPENMYDDLELLYLHSPALLKFIMPEFMALQDSQLPEKRHGKFSLIDHTLLSIKKIQALIKKDRTRFQDIRFLYKIAQREFGPLAAGIVGLSETQIATLESIAERLSQKKSLFEALIQSFLFRDIGLNPLYKTKYAGRIHPADHAEAGIFILKEERILDRFDLESQTEKYLIALVKHHNLIQHLIRGEYSFYAIQDVIDYQDRDLFEACFLSSFIMFYAFGDEQVLEDLALKLFQLRIFCHRILDGETTADKQLLELYASNGLLLEAYEAYLHSGLPEGIIPAQYFESYVREHTADSMTMEEGRMIYAMERLFRLRGIHYVEFSDLVHYMIKVPVRFTYQKKHLYDIGFATYEKEIYEAQRVFRHLQLLPSQIRNFLLQHLVIDEIRIFGFEQVSTHLNYENMIKLLLIALIGSRKFSKRGGSICLDFFDLLGVMGKHYEAVNAFMQDIPPEMIWYDYAKVDQCFMAKTGLILRKDDEHRVLSIGFVDKIDISQYVNAMQQIKNLEELKRYWEGSLAAMQDIPFNTDEYKTELHRAYDARLLHITEGMLEQARKHMARVDEFDALRKYFNECKDRMAEAEFSDEQRHRLNDMFELKKENLKQNKIASIERMIASIQDQAGLRDYWSNLKGYLRANRSLIGKEFENLVARRFDERMAKLQSSEMGF